MATLPIQLRTAPFAALAFFIVAPASVPAAEPERAMPAAEEAASETLGGDLGGLRTAFAAAGLELGISYVGEVLGIVSGGTKRDAIYEGEVELSLDANLEKMMGWTGATAHVSAINVHGRGPSNDLLGGNLMDVSNIEARTVTRLYTLWLEQSLFGDRVAVRVGQLAADDEFLASDTAGNLINGTFGWAALASSDMTQGGPVYPLPAPGIRLRLSPTDRLTLLAGVFAGNPGGEGCVGDPQICNPHGTTFSLSGGALWIAELQYAAGGGTYKLGAWRETGAFPNHFTGANDKHGDWGVYGVVDRRVWTRPGTEDQGLSVFLRAGGAPEDRNQVSWYVDGGLGFKGPFARADDVVTLGAAYANISDRLTAADWAAGNPVDDYEAVIELSYIAQVLPYWSLQPDLQYVIHPGGTPAIDDVLVLGLRTSIDF